MEGKTKKSGKWSCHTVSFEPPFHPPEADRDSTFCNLFIQKMLHLP